MPIQSLLSRDAPSCRPDQALDLAAARLWESDCGSLPVCVADDGGEPRVIGVLTDRDVCMAALFKGPLHAIKVADAMSRDLRAARPRNNAGKPSATSYI